ncbi:MULTISPECIES: hypothetical protein [unclassified Microcoleus]
MFSELWQEGSSATSNVGDVTDVTDVTEVRKKEEGRGKREEGFILAINL